MLLNIWQQMQALENTLSDYNTYRMYSTIVTEGANFAMIQPDSDTYSEQPTLDIEQVRILPMSHKYDPSRVFAGLLIYSVDGQTDFILNDAMLRIKTGDILIHQIHHALVGQEDVYRDLIRTLFGTHRINLIGLVFTFSGNGDFSDCMRWTPASSNHKAPIHPTEKKLLEIVLISLYMNHAWLSMPLATHVDVDELSRTTKKQYFLKLAEIEKLLYKQQDRRDKLLPIPNILKLGRHHHHSSDNFQSFEWTPNREQSFDSTVRDLLDKFYNLIEQTLPDGEFDPDQYAYYDDNTKHLFSNLANGYVPRAANPASSNYSFNQNYL